MKTIEEFCIEHQACDNGREWALAHCDTMADVWATAKPEWLVWVATRPGVLTDRELRLLAIFCARQVEHLLTDQRSRDAIDVAEKFTSGEATREELAAAADAARVAARAAARAADWAAAAAADAARVAAWDAAWVAAWDAAWVAARDAAWVAARIERVNWLRENTAPKFGG